MLKLKIASGLFFLIVSFAYASPVEAPESLITKVYDKVAITGLILDTASKYGVSSLIMRKIIRCESNYNQKAIGDNGNSYGLVQIFLKAHPEVSKEDAFNPEFAIDFLGRELSKGNGAIWTCFRQITQIKDV